jgi:hypothetical protein
MIAGLNFFSLDVADGLILKKEQWITHVSMKRSPPGRNCSAVPPGIVWFDEKNEERPSFWSCLH